MIENISDITYIQKILLMLLQSMIKVFLVLIITYIFTRIIIYSVDKVILSVQKAKKQPPQRIKTIQALINNLIKYSMGIIGSIFVLIYLGVRWEGILASAGLIGLIVGIGAQELISDTINGFFIIFEGTYDIDEYVQIGSFEGYVKELGIKSTVLETFENKKITIPNSNVQEVVNYSKNNYMTIYRFSTSYDDKIEYIEEITMTKIIPKIIKLEEVYNVEYLGLDEFMDSSIVYALKVLTDPEDRLKVKRNINSIVKKIFDSEGLEIPFNNITVNYKSTIDNSKHDNN